MVDSTEGHPDADNHSHSVPGATASTTSGSGNINGQDNLLPIANVGRIMKQVLPPSAKISKKAKETMQECASEFISFVTEEASDRCRKEKRKTVNGDDICFALKTLGFDEYAEATNRYLYRFREHGEKATTLSLKHNESNQIDITDEPSTLRSGQSRNQPFAPSSHESNETERTKRFL